MAYLSRKIGNKIVVYNLLGVQSQNIKMVLDISPHGIKSGNEH